jgi:hypothetical protein
VAGDIEEAAGMGSSEKFCLKWNDFQTNISTSFQDLRKDQDFSDVTLTCDGDIRIKAHRVILAGSSKFFSRVLKQQQHPHPLLYMRGVTALWWTSSTTGRRTSTRRIWMASLLWLRSSS